MPQKKKRITLSSTSSYEEKKEEESRDKMTEKKNGGEKQEEVPYPCQGCNMNVDAGGVLCKPCNKWWHYRCDKTTERKVKTDFPPGTPYTCKAHQKEEEALLKKKVNAEKNAGNKKKMSKLPSKKHKQENKKDTSEGEESDTSEKEGSDYEEEQMNTLRELKEKIEKLEHEEEQKKLIKELKANMDKLEIQIEQKDEEIEQKDEEIAKMKEERTKEREVAEGKIRKLEEGGEKAREREKMNNSQKSKQIKAQEDLKRNAQRLEKCNLQLKNKVGIYEEQIKTLQSTTETYDQRIISLNKEKESLEKKLTAAEESIKLVLDEEKEENADTSTSKQPTPKRTMLAEVKKELAKRIREIKKIKDEQDKLLEENANIKEEQFSTKNAVRHLTEYLDLVKKINKDLELTLSRNGLSSEVIHSKEQESINQDNQEKYEEMEDVIRNERVEDLSDNEYIEKDVYWGTSEDEFELKDGGISVKKKKVIIVSEESDKDESDGFDYVEDERKARGKNNDDIEQRIKELRKEAKERTDRSRRQDGVEEQELIRETEDESLVNERKMESVNKKRYTNITSDEERRKPCISSPDKSKSNDNRRRKSMDKIMNGRLGIKHDKEKNKTRSGEKQNARNSPGYRRRHEHIQKDKKQIPCKYKENCDFGTRCWFGHDKENSDGENESKIRCEENDSFLLEGEKIRDKLKRVKEKQD